MHRIFALLAGVILLGAFFVHPFPGFASDPCQKNAAPQIQAAIDYVLALAEKGRPAPLDMQKLAALLAFVDSSGKNLGESYSMGKRHGAVSDYYEFSVRRCLKDLLELVYNPDLPSALFCPASLRRAHWLEVDGKAQPLPNLSRRLETLTGPLAVYGSEFIENTPDTTSGAYYAYDLQRMLILARYQDRPVLVSVSVQPERSDVGRKGLVVGSDNDWNYVYTGEKGCMLAGLGWADSYMYYSASIMVYLEIPSSPRQVRCAGFKWIRAGWAGMNMVKPHHIRKGVERFASTFKEILDSPRLPDAGELTRAFRQIENLSTDQLRAKSRVYMDYLSGKGDATRKTDLKWLKRLSRDRNYLQSLGREELLSLVTLEYLKSVLGKSHCLDCNAFSAADRKRNPS